MFPGLSAYHHFPHRWIRRPLVGGALKSLPQSTVLIELKSTFREIQHRCSVEFPDFFLWEIWSFYIFLDETPFLS